MRAFRRYRKCGAADYSEATSLPLPLGRAAKLGYPSVKRERIGDIAQQFAPFLFELTYSGQSYSLLRIRDKFSDRALLRPPQFDARGREPDRAHLGDGRRIRLRTTRRSWRTRRGVEIGRVPSGGSALSADREADVETTRHGAWQAGTVWESVARFVTVPKADSAAEAGIGAPRPDPSPARRCAKCIQFRPAKAPWMSALATSEAARFPNGFTPDFAARENSPSGPDSWNICDGEPTNRAKTKRANIA